MRAGVSIIDPSSTFIDPEVEIGQDTTILPGVQLHGHCVIGGDVTVGPDTTLTDVTIHDRAEVVRTHGFGAVIGEGATVGPFTYLRPGTVLGARGKNGGFCETKNAEIGEGTNIGAATIFANYDGVNKHRSVVGKHVRVGSDSVLVAPVTIGDGAATGAGTIVLKDVPPGALAVNATKPRITEGWTLTKRTGTAAAEAAEKALDHDSRTATTEEK